MAAALPIVTRESSVGVLYRHRFVVTSKAGTVCGVMVKKAIPLLSWTGPKVSRRLRLPNFKTVGT